MVGGCMGICGDGIEIPNLFKLFSCNAVVFNCRRALCPVHKRSAVGWLSHSDCGSFKVHNLVCMHVKW